MLLGFVGPSVARLGTGLAGAIAATLVLVTVTLFRRRRRGDAPEEGTPRAKGGPGASSDPSSTPRAGSAPSATAGRPAQRPEYLEDVDEPPKLVAATAGAADPKGAPSSEEPPPDLNALLAQLDRLSEQIRRRPPARPAPTDPEEAVPSGDPPP